ncbi:MAG: 4-hydroxythreonine-4-phosphate dehydrogenase PdxA [Pseudomonadota bacterium]
MKPIAVTVGDPAGIGPELCVRLAAGSADVPLVFVGSGAALRQAAESQGQPLELVPFRAGQNAPRQLLDVPAAAPVQPGTLNTRNSPAVVEMLERAFDGCAGGDFAAMVTCPVHKGVINDAGIAFTGHTEFLAQRSNTRRVVMLLAAGDLRVALATTHLPLARVSEAIDRSMLSETLAIIDQGLRQRFGIANPAIAVCGLNPHAGEGGHLGTEERDTITPTVESLRARGMKLTGPLPADTAFTPRVLERHDAVLAMYHDQGLPVLKYVGFGSAINVTLGLPIVRTSVDHGTALDIAGQGIADPGSLQAALATAVTMAS